MYRGSPSFNNYHDMISSYTRADWPNWLLCLLSRRINISIVTTIEATEAKIVQLTISFKYHWISLNNQEVSPEANLVDYLGYIEDEG